MTGIAAITLTSISKRCYARAERGELYTKTKPSKSSANEPQPAPLTL